MQLASDDAERIPEIGERNTVTQAGDQRHRVSHQSIVEVIPPAQAQGNAGYNWGYYSNPQLDKLLDSASAEPDEKKRFALYAQAQKLLVEESPALFVYEKNYRLPMNGKLQGFVFNGVYIETLDFYALHKE